MKVALHNLGCKVNAYETDAMKQLFEKKGYEIVSFSDMADIYIINTCSVTNIADRKSRQMLHRAKKMNENAVVVAVGCYAQVAAEQLEKDDAVDVIVGNNKKKEIVDIVEEYLKDNNKFEAVIDIGHDDTYEDFEMSTVTEHTRAYIKIQDGCNQFCSYCIIPYARGRIRSRNIDSIREEVEKLAGQGYKEFVFTGIHLSSYNYEGKTFADVIELVDSIEGVERIRLGSLEPGIVTEDFVQRISKCKSVCPHFHLSMQSGCDSVLKRMNRKYTSEEYYERCELLRKYFDNPAFTTDVIVGFPQETEEEYQVTEDFVKKVGFAELHVFKYSMRNGTVAAKMEGQVDDSIKADRSDRLIGVGEKLTEQYRKQFVGKNIEVLIEEPVVIEEKTYQIGHTMEYIKVAVESEEDLSGQIVTVTITDDANNDFPGVNQMMFAELV
ncbi:MAG: tRNA (N(6)-L-threonylcarbamoyladenosine(37)-C(2))-methylthiotransferase MtaB [Lachnospiraceae bacterium]|nr:tRNA (N(6)-L-threonylcarbamoyladenosine(37)-C(2))-methylthiotransferase MtaB [Lachnospiraceae bacterium]